MKSKLARTYKLPPEVVAQIEARAKSLDIGYAEYVCLLVRNKGSTITSPKEEFGKLIQGVMSKEDGQAIEDQMLAHFANLDDRLEQLGQAVADHFTAAPDIGEITTAMMDWHRKVAELESRTAEQATLISELRRQLFKCKFLATRALSPEEQSALKIANDRLSYLEDEIARWHQSYPWDEFFREQRTSQQIAAVLRRQGGAAS